MIKVGGEGVSAFEIETVIAAVPGVNANAVVAGPDPNYGEVAVAFVVAAKGTDPDTLKDRVLERCRISLAKFKVPRDVIVVDALPRVGFGKIAKVALRERLAR